MSGESTFAPDRWRTDGCAGADPGSPRSASPSRRLDPRRFSHWCPKADTISANKGVAQSEAPGSADHLPRRNQPMSYAPPPPGSPAPAPPPYAQPYPYGGAVAQGVIFVIYVFSVFHTVCTTQGVTCG